MGWCALVDKIQKKIIRIGLNQFNATSTKLKAQTSGKFKRWNKEFSVSTLSELQAVFDTDLIVVLEGMGLLDGNEAERLETCFQHRNHSAHPGEAPIAERSSLISMPLFCKTLNSTRDRSRCSLEESFVPPPG